MTIHQYLIKACRDDARRGGERDRLLLEARRARVACRQRPGPAAPARLVTRLLFRRATAYQGTGPPRTSQSQARGLHSGTGYPSALAWLASRLPTKQPQNTPRPPPAPNWPSRA